MKLVRQSSIDQAVAYLKGKGFRVRWVSWRVEVMRVDTVIWYRFTVINPKGRRVGGYSVPQLKALASEHGWTPLKNVMIPPGEVMKRTRQREVYSLSPTERDDLLCELARQRAEA